MNTSHRRYKNESLNNRFKWFYCENLIQSLSEEQDIEILCYHRQSSEKTLIHHVLSADWIIHLAGANRPPEEQEFMTSNTQLTEKICRILQRHQKKRLCYIPLAFK